MSESPSTNISMAHTNSTESIQAFSARHSRTDPGSTKRIYFYKSGDPQFNGIKMVVSNRSFKTFDALLDSLSKKVPLPFGVRNISTPRGIHHITSLEELEDGRSYICSHQRKIKPINLERASRKPLLWQSSRPLSARRRAAQLSRQIEASPFQRKNTVVIGSSRNFVIFKNGDAYTKHDLVLDKRATQSFDVILDQVSETLQFPVFKLYNTDGRRILSTHALLLSSGTIVAAGREPFKPVNYDSDREFLPPKLPGISQRVFPKSRSKPFMKSPGKWKVSIFTSGIPTAGTTSQVYIIFYGHLRASTPVFLYSSQEDAFQSGSEDTFDVNIGDVGEVYKVRIGHTNSGASPGWHCEEVQLLNIISNEQFCINVKRWLSQEEDDGEICRELPVLRHGQVLLPVTRYKVQVVTGDLWNAGTEANVYISLHGQYGDTGSRQLLRSNKPTSFGKGQIDTFYVEAVHLGKLHTVIIGHDGLGPGNGWYLEKVNVYDELKDKEYTFLCYRWLDEGEDDRKIARRLPVSDGSDLQERHELELRRNETWNAEMWKYKDGNTVQFYCKATRRFIRLTPDGKVDATGDKKDKYGLFEVLVKRGKVRVFRSHHIRNLALAVDKGIASSMDSSGVLCELQLHVQLNRCVILESTRMPGMTISFNSDGEPADDSTTRYAEVSQEFMVHVKGIFHAGAVILLGTSWSQALCLRADGSCSGAGKQNVESYWRVHKVSSAVCMFESVTWPRMFLQIKNGNCDGEGKGDEFCQFKVDKNYEDGSVTLESVRSKGIFVGLLPNGVAKPVIHTGEKNIVFYPQIIKFGREKPTGTSATPSKKKEVLEKQDEGIFEAHVAADQSPSVYPTSNRIGREKPTGTPATPSNKKEVFPKQDEGIVEAKVAADQSPSVSPTPNRIGREKPTGTSATPSKKKEVLEKQDEGIEAKVAADQSPSVSPTANRIGREKPTGTPATPSNQKEVLPKQDEGIVEAKVAADQSPSVSPTPNRNEGVEVPAEASHLWKVSLLTGSTGTSADINLWVYGSDDSAGPIFLESGKNGFFKARQEDQFVVEFENVGKIYKIRIGHDGTGDDPEWKLKMVTLQQMNGGEVYCFEANRWLSRSRGNSELVCELPVMENGLPVFPVVNYEINVFTGHLEQAGTKAPVYICLYGERGDSGKRLLYKPDLSNAFQQGQVDVFEIEAVSLGKLRSLRLSCQANHKAQYWYCEKVIIRERGDISEYIFNCERWLPFMSKGILHSEIELKVQEMDALSKIKQPPEIIDGEWKVTVVTGNFPNAGTDASVFLYVYSEEANSGPIMLGSGSHQLFNVNSVDTFQINLKYLEKPYKIRIGHDNSGDSPEWYLEEITLQNLSSNLEFHLPVNQWLGEELDWGTWKEMYLEIDESDPLPLLDYEVHIYTGAISEADMEANVYLTIFGSRGDSGKRKMHKTKSGGAKFQRGNVDVFSIQAISLGELQKILISTEGIKNGKGWFLDKVTVQYTQDGKNHLVLFPCNRWLDENREDGKTERILFASERENPEEDIEGKMWTIHLRTAIDSSDTDALKIIFVFYGTNGKTSELCPLPKGQDRKNFLPNTEDQFFVKIKDIGEIYKMRIVCDHLPIAPGWHMEHVYVSEPQSLQEIHFDGDCWLSAESEEEEVVKEFRVRSSEQELLPVNQYIVAVHTGDRWGAETAANVYVTLYGERGDSGARKLYTSLTPGEKFTRKKTDCFMLEAVSLGHLRKVILGHDREGYGAGMYLKMVTVKESQDSTTEWVFPLWNWLDSHLGLQETVCKLYAIGKRLTSTPKPVTGPRGSWIIDLTGSGYQSADSLNYFSIWFYGDSGKERVEIAISGDTLTTQEELHGAGAMYKVQVSWSHTQMTRPWLLSSIHMKHTVTLQEMWLHFNCRMQPNEDGCVELPALLPERDPLPVVEYTLAIHTGDGQDGGSPGNVYICMEGQHGDSGKHFLQSSGTDMPSFGKEKVSIFQIKAVYLGDIQKVVLGHSNSKQDSWFLEKITVQEDYTSTKYAFHYNNWITCKSDGEFTETEIILKESMEEMIEVKSFDAATQGKWQLRVLGGTLEAEEDLDLSIVLYGKAGSSKHKVMNLDYDPFLLSVGDIGDIMKASFLSSALSSENRLQLQKIRMQDVDTKQEVSFYPDEGSVPEPGTSESLLELAAVYPGKVPLSEVIYSVYIKTGHLPAAGTSADVFITISGENGDSCKRFLRHASFPKTFDQGKVDVFRIKALDLGILRSAHIEHNGVGYGAGWYLDQITIQASDKADIKYLFPCQRWLDTAVNDKQTGCNTKLLGTFHKTNQSLLSSTEGTVSVIVETANDPSLGTNAKVLLTICCEKGSYEPLEFTKEALTHSRPSQKSLELRSDLGAIHKIRLQLEDGGSDSSWDCRMVKLEHQPSGDIIEFPFFKLFSSKSKQLYAELPALNSLGPLLTVKCYDLCISTSQIPKPVADTVLFITLKGTMGDTGRRKCICKKKDLASKEQAVRFQLEAVDIGVIQELLIEKEKQTNLQLKHAVVEEGSFIKNKYIFIAEPWKNRKNKMMSMALQVTEVKAADSSGVLLDDNQSLTSYGEWRMYLSARHNENQITDTLDSNLQIVIIFYGDKGRSNPIRLEADASSENTDILAYKVNLTHDLGELFKVRLGLEGWQADRGRLSLHHLKMQNTRTLDMFNQSINKTLPLSLSGDRWIEVPVEWPLKASLSAVTYLVTLYPISLREQQEKLNIGISLHGKHGDTGHRYLKWQSTRADSEDESFTAVLEAVELGNLQQADISMSSRDGCKLHIKRIHVKESSKRKLYVFDVNEDFSIDHNSETRKALLISQVVDDNEKDSEAGHDASNQTGSLEGERVEHEIKVYTGNVRGAGTDANVYIILFAEKGNSFGPVQLTRPLEDKDSFERGKVDKFIISTKDIGRISRIEIGHNGAGLGSGWFLDKIELTPLSTNEKMLFNCNRWLAEDEDDGRTSIQLYPE